jgi:hypothetical protein
MNKHISTIVAAIACFLFAICLVQIADMKQQIQNLQGNLGNYMTGTQNSINSIYSNIESKLEEQANLLAGSEWAFGEADIDAETVMLQCSVTPKEYQPEGTSAVLFCNGAEYPMTLTNGEYAAELPISLFEDSVVGKVQFEESGTIRTESLNWHISPRYEFLPNVYANFSGSGRGSAGEGSYVWSRKGQVEINVERKGDTTDVQSIAMIEYIDGKETKRTDIPLNTTPSSPQSYGTAYMEPARRVGDAGASPSYFYYPLDNDFEIPFGSTFDLYIEVVDGYGLHYRVLIDHAEVGSGGKLMDDQYDHWQGFGASIYDDNGNALYMIDEKPYK